MLATHVLLHKLAHSKLGHDVALCSRQMIGQPRIKQACSSGHQQEHQQT